MTLFFRWTIAACLWLLLATHSQAAIKMFSYEHKQQMCMGTALWMESRGESLRGQRAVYDVVKSRSKDWNLDKCEVIYSKGQFPWSKQTRLVSQKKWKEMYHDVVKHPPVLDSRYKWFYNPRLAKPKWAAKMDCKRIGQHNFCKEKERV